MGTGASPHGTGVKSVIGSARLSAWRRRKFMLATGVVALGMAGRALTDDRATTAEQLAQRAMTELPESVRQTLNGQPGATGGRLLGSARFRMYGFHVYDARLFVSQQGVRPEDPTATPFALELRYARAFKGVDIAERSRDEIAHVGIGHEGLRAAWLEQMRRLFPDVQSDDVLLGVNEPGSGARFYHNGKRIGSVDDADFARAFFAIWLHPRTRAPALRRALLGLA